jgi:cation diffusion facilitator CzcD-associated flavoprotein CzcO
LENYARHFDLSPRLNEPVITTRRRDGAWETRTPKAVYLSEALIVASGNNQQAARPRWPGQDGFAGTILHSIDYKNGRPFKGQKVLVVGLGNSGGDIALDLYEHGARPSICVKGPVNILPRDWLGIPILKTADHLAQLPMAFSDYLRSTLFNRFCYNLPQFGLVRPPYDPITQINRLGKLPLIDTGTIPLIKKGLIKIYPGIAGFTNKGVRFEDGRVEDFDAVVLATGYNPRLDAFLEASPGLLDRHGRPRTKGCKTNVPGLYFCGFTVSTAGILKAIGQEARLICQCIAESGSINSD